MIAKIISSVVVVLALGAGVVYAATQLTSSNGTQVCVNQTNGLMRASSTCRDGEYAMTIGGGGDAVVKSGGTVTVGLGATSSPVTLPLTGLSVVAGCDRQPTPPPPYSPDASVARLVISAQNGTMDAVSSSTDWVSGDHAGTFGGVSLTFTLGGVSSVGDIRHYEGSTIASANATFGVRRVT